MKFWGSIALVLSFILVINLVFAFENDFPSKVTVEQDRVNLSFVVTNTLPYAIDFTAELFVPSNYQFVGLPKTIKANSSKQINLTVFYDDSLEGLSYNGKIIFYAGNDRISKNFSIQYNGSEPVDIEIKPIKTLPEINTATQPSDSNNFDANGAIAGFVSVFFKPSLELVLVIVLILIAAILLIAFVSRFVKRIQK